MRDHRSTDLMWISGRTYVHLVPELTLDQIMSSEEVATWHGRVAPARETDLFGPYRVGTLQARIDRLGL